MPGRMSGSAASFIASFFQLWRLHAWMDLLWSTRCLKMALTYFISDGIVSIGMIADVLLLAERFGGIGRWDRPHILFLLGYALLVGGLLETLFGYNILLISRRIGRGQLDHMLVQPQPMILILLTEGFMPISGSPTLIAGIGLLLWSAAGLHLPITAGRLFLAALNLAASCLVVLSFTFLWGSLAFWEPRAAEEINSSTVQLLTQLKSFPLDGLGAAVVAGMLTAVPAGFVAWFPCRSLLGLAHSPWDAAITPLAALMLSLLSAAAFHQGMKQYGRTGSQRYHDLGHRR